MCLRVCVKEKEIERKRERERHTSNGQDEGCYLCSCFKGECAHMRLVCVMVKKHY